MATIKGSVEADVPVAFADEEWTEFVLRSLYGSYQRGFGDVAVALGEIDAESGTVTFEAEDQGRVRITVVAEYRPRGGDPSTDVSRAESLLQRDLEKYRVFLLRRCTQERCRSN